MARPMNSSWAARPDTIIIRVRHGPWTVIAQPNTAQSWAESCRVINSNRAVLDCDDTIHGLACVELGLARPFCHL